MLAFISTDHCYDYDVDYHHLHALPPPLYVATYYYYYYFFSAFKHLRLPVAERK